MRQGNGVFTAGERAGLKRAQAVNHDSNQRLMCDAIDTNLFDWSVLKEDRNNRSLAITQSFNKVVLGRIRNGAEAADLVAMVGTALSRLIGHVYVQLHGLIAANDMVCKCSHFEWTEDFECNTDLI